MVEFTANNNKLAFIKLSLFFASNILHPHISFNIVELSNTSTWERIHK